MSKTRLSAFVECFDALDGLDDDVVFAILHAIAQLRSIDLTPHIEDSDEQ